MVSDFLVAFFSTCVRGTRIIVTSQLVADVLHVPRVEFPDYPSCEHLRTVTKDELKSAFCERPSEWSECQFTYYSGFAKGPRFLNMVMTFALHPLSHYNSITEPRAQFLSSFLEHLTIDFPSHFILSIIDVHLDSVSRDKLIFPSTITRILCHFIIPFPVSDHFTHEASSQPPPVASDSKDEDDDDGDDDDASNDDDGDSSSINDMST